MELKTLLQFVGTAVSVVGVTTLVACTPTGGDWGEDMVPLDSAPASSAASSPTWRQVHRVSISNGAFVPAYTRINAGTVVMWKNKDSQTHTVVGDQLADLRSKPITLGKVYTYLFDKPGTYTYHCAEHPMETGTVEVLEQGASISSMPSLPPFPGTVSRDPW